MTKRCGGSSEREALSAEDTPAIRWSPVRFFVVALGIGTVAAFVACGSFSADEETPPGADAAADTTHDAAPSPREEGGPVDAGLDGDAAPDGMVLFASGPTRYWIDARETTVGEYIAFRDSKGSDAGLPMLCGFKNGTLGPRASCTAPGTATLPMVCVDWCDAFAYCTFVGKRLCGRIGGGAPTPFPELASPLVNEWTRACANGVDTTVYPYGPMFEAGVCNTSETSSALKPPGSLAGCKGGLPGLFDMSGNVAEWDDSCAGTSGAGDNCGRHGGSYTQNSGAVACSSAVTKGRDSAENDVGIRCCKDY